MSFTLPLTRGQEGTWAELLALGPAAYGAMLDTSNDVHLAGPAPIGYWLYDARRVLNPGPRRNSNDQYTPLASVKLYVVAPAYDPLDHVVSGGYIGVEVWDVLATAQRSLDGTPLYGSYDYGDGNDFPEPTSAASPYYTVLGTGVVGDGNRNLLPIAASTRATRHGFFYRLGTVQATWLGPREGPVFRPPPSPTNVACPVCRTPAPYRACNLLGCPGNTVAAALVAFTLGETCQRCQRPAWRSDVVAMTGANAVLRECSDCRGKRLVAPMNGVPTDIIRFGVELETEGISYSSQAGEVAAKQRALLPGARWTAKADGSLRGAHAEVITPPLAFCEESITILQEGTRAMRRAGAMVSERCGLHVHVDVSPLSPRQLHALIRHWVSAQALVLAAHPPLEYRRRFCSSVGQESVEMSRVYLDQGSERSHWYKITRSDRYATLNFGAMKRHGTVEFRLWNGTVHAGKVAAYVRFGVHLVSYASRNADPEASLPPRPATREGVLNLLDDLGITCASARWHLLGRFQQAADRPARGHVGPAQSVG